MADTMSGFSPSAAIAIANWKLIQLTAALRAHFPCRDVRNRAPFTASYLNAYR
jgi:hypothetical protein